jgi:membrane fusion protein, multidrug efflux system
MRKPRTWITIVIIAAALVTGYLLLKPKAAEESEEVAADMAVHTGTVVRASLHRTVTAYGVIEPEPATAGRVPADAEVASPVAGIVAHIDCAEGQRVAKGDVLFRLDSRVADVAFQKATKALAYAQDNFTRQAKLLPVEGTSKRAYLEAEAALAQAKSDLAAAETDLALLRIQAPLAGTVVKVNSEPGEAVESSTVLAKIIDLGRLVAALNVPSREAGLVTPGQAARFEGLEGEAGKVLYVGAQVDDKNDSVAVRTSLPAGSSFRPGQFVSVRIICEEKADSLAVPEAAAVADAIGADTGQIVAVEGEKAVRKPVKFGLREGGLVEISGEGIKEGLVIVTEDAYAVPNDTKIHVLKPEAPAAKEAKDEKDEKAEAKEKAAVPDAKDKTGKSGK